MDLGNLTLFKLMSQKMAWLSQRQDVLAQNIANTDTPGYKPNDLKPFTFQSAMAGDGLLQPAVTNPMHLAGVDPNAGRGFRTDKESKAYETEPSGNSVVLEEQMMKVSKTQADYQLITNLYSKQVGLMKTALDQGGGS